MAQGRRRVVATLALAALGALPARAQQRPARVIFFSRGPPADLAAIRDAFRDQGLVDGQNVILEARDAGGSSSRMGDVAREIARVNPDLIVALQGEAAHAAKAATLTIPIVFTMGDPVAEGLLTSMTRPGGNATGVASFNDELAGKRVEVLRDALPTLRRLAVIHTGTRGSDAQLAAYRQAAAALGLEFVPILVTNDELPPAFEAAVRRGADALALISSASFRGRVVPLAARHRLPVIYDEHESVEQGGLLSYGIDRVEVRRRTAAFVDRILKGAKPGDLPVERPTLFELAINLKTARALGLTIPPSLVARADRVIE